MIVTTTTETVPYTHPWVQKVDGAPVFHLRAGSTIERGQMTALLDGPLQAAKVWSHQLREAQLKGIDALFAEEPEYDRLVAIFSAEGEEAEQLSDDDKKLAKAVDPLLVKHWPAYADLVAQMERRRTLVPIVALTRYCTGWENVRDENGAVIPFEADKNGHVADRALRRLQEVDLLFAGSRAFSLQFGGGEEKNFERPSSSEDGPKTSKSASPRAKGGRSKARGGRKTPA
ncbi:hypothetical protein CA233_19175 [Sphingomonas sp. ABOLD]|uniref:Uncharacterized protein n=1 Tax=Sphingomonas trueperi TaxID=53317 RepID=A0A7X5Y2G9_9SPHN|nr:MULTISPECIES: hypothetical protein [Sphingomonas]NJB99433.1 hypothetical protein [Sphingomonas trueperi]RSV35181.1 hypothetical protein CA234_20325 [Sphingomonas sp. ABOLE]RSV40962.1 hypothetical protein CA233_19175 [Sphingomonas sp. ABOLD]